MKLSKKLISCSAVAALLAIGASTAQADPRVTVTWQKPAGVDIHQVHITKINDGKSCVITDNTDSCSFTGIFTGGNAPKVLFRLAWVPDAETNGNKISNPAQVHYLYLDLPSRNDTGLMEYFYDVPAHNVNITNNMDFQMAVGITSSRVAEQGLRDSLPVSHHLRGVTRVSTHSLYYDGTTKTIPVLDGCYTVFAVEKDCPGSGCKFPAHHTPLCVGGPADVDPTAPANAITLTPDSFL
ncbi:hypothetical protein [Methyloprofundus sp.]|uniref:hypothetical protein n=1 Tax=Methyloprofundus sp. TaxID=2020875 RepID=UPI003D13E0F4